MRARPVVSSLSQSLHILCYSHYIYSPPLPFYQGLASDSLGVAAAAAVAAHRASRREKALAGHSIRPLLPHERRSHLDGGGGPKLHVLGVCSRALEGRPRLYAARGTWNAVPIRVN